MDWLLFSLIDVIDIIVVGLLLYYTYDALRKSGSGSLFIGIISSSSRMDPHLSDPKDEGPRGDHGYCDDECWYLRASDSLPR